jgi:phage gpG-like protein
MDLRMQVFGLQELRDNFKAIQYVMGNASKEIDFALNRTIIPEARRNVWELFNTDGDFPSRIVTQVVNQYRVDIEVRAVYGAVHEYGGTFTITPRQRRFFWAKFYETGDDLWKALALSVQYTIPARPYLRPAIDAKEDEAMKLAARILWEEMGQVVYLKGATATRFRTFEAILASHTTSWRERSR